MNIFNRVLVMVFSVVLLALGAGALLLTLLAPYEATFYAQSLATYLGEQVSFTNRLAVGLGGAVATILGIFLLVLELPSRARNTVHLRKINGGSGVLTVGAIAQRAQHEVELLADVRRVKPQVTSRGKSVDIQVEMVTDPYAEAAAKTEEACQAIRDSVEAQMGVRVRRIEVRVSHEPIVKEGTPSKLPSDMK